MKNWAEAVFALLELLPSHSAVHLGKKNFGQKNFGGRKVHSMSSQRCQNRFFIVNKQALSQNGSHFTICGLQEMLITECIAAFEHFHPNVIDEAG